MELNQIRPFSCGVGGTQTREKGERAMSSSLAGTVGLWWVAAALAAIASRKVLEGDPDSQADSTGSGPWAHGLRGVDLSLLQHALGILLAFTWGRISGQVVCSVDVFRGQFGAILVITVCNILGNLATYAAFSLEESSLASAVIASQPLYTLALVYVRQRREEPPRQISKLALAVVVLGAILFVLGKPTFSVWGVVLAVASSFAFPVKNVAMKSLSHESGSSPLQNFAIMSVYSVLFLTPVCLVKQVLIGGSTIWSDRSIISSLFYSVYSIASVTILDQMNPVSHAVLGVGQRLFFALASIIRFSVPFSTNMTFGLLILLFGFYLYQFRSSRWILIKKCLISLVLFHFLMVSVFKVDFLDSKQPARRSCTVESRISIAWIHDRPIPKNIVENIALTAKNSPGIPVHVYCGTTQCMNAVSSLGNGKIEVEFAVLPEILSGTPLEQWLAHHSFHKLLVRKAFETHLQEAVRLGLLWQYGGFYFSPTIKLNQQLFLPQCHRGNAAKFLGSIVLPKERTMNIFDAVYFSKHHPLIHQLAKLFVDSYPTLGKADIPVKFPYAERVWKLFQDNHTCLYCLMDLNNFLQMEYVNVTKEENREHYSTLSFASRVDSIQSTNLGDEIQGFPGLQFLPFLDYFVDRDNFESGIIKNSTTIFFNGWWGSSSNRSWSPPSSLNPVMVSIHAQRGKMVKAWADYAKKRNQSIGCRDLATLDHMQSHGVSAFLSGCMTLLIRNPNVAGTRNAKIYIVDVNSTYLRLIPKHVREKAVVLHHSVTSRGRHRVERFIRAYNLLKIYASAKLVITQRLHAALPCVAMETPVIFINSANMPGGGGTRLKASSRVVGLTELFHTIDVYTATAESELERFPYDDPLPNPNPALVMKLRATTWNVIRQHESLRDAGKKFGMIPLSPPQSLLKQDRLVFHLVFTASESVLGGRPVGRFDWKRWRSVEAIFYHHPTAAVLVHSNTLPMDTFDVLSESGYSIYVVRYDLEKMILRSPCDDFIIGVDMVMEDMWFHSHSLESDLVRLMVLYERGGIYMDTDVILVRPINNLQEGTVGWADNTTTTLESKIMIFEITSDYIRACLEAFWDHYFQLQANWSTGNGLNTLLTSTREEWEQGVSSEYALQVLPHTSFYNIIRSVKSIGECFRVKEGVKSKADLNIIRNLAYGVILNSDLSGHVGVSLNPDLSERLTNGTLCNYLLNSFCVLCNNIHTAY